LSAALVEARPLAVRSGRGAFLRKGSKMKLALSRVSIAVAGALLLAGCASNRVHKGAVIDMQLASSIQPGVDNKASVEKLLGRPTFTGQFTPNEWYYVSRDTNQLAFRNPRPTRQTVLHISFDAKGNVAAINRTGKELVMNVDPVHRNTPTLGRKKSFFEELFGNIGTVSAGGNTGP
jgi:outer membrane protein assembly factor BamE (lipoprotein component of BamABCDE complex)